MVVVVVERLTLLLRTVEDSSMSLRRKLQLVSTGMIFAAAIGLLTLAPPSAHGTTCNPAHECFQNFGYDECITLTNGQLLQICNAIPHDSGCTAFSATCERSITGCTNGGVVCLYH